MDGRCPNYVWTRVATHQQRVTGLEDSQRHAGPERHATGDLPVAENVMGNAAPALGEWNVPHQTGGEHLRAIILRRTTLQLRVVGILGRVAAVLWGGGHNFPVVIGDM